MRLFSIFTLIFFAGCASKNLNREPSSSYSLTEPVQINSSGPVLSLPIDKFFVFQKDTLSVPINVSDSSTHPNDYRIDFELLMRSDQKQAFALFGPGDKPKPHWINGYTPDNSLKQGPFENFGLVRVQKDLPIRKYMRLNIPEGIAAGIYKGVVSLKNENDEVLQSKIIEIGVHDSLKYFWSIEDSHLRVRDVFGNVSKVSQPILIQSKKNRVINLQPMQKGDSINIKGIELQNEDYIRAKIFDSVVDIYKYDR